MGSARRWFLSISLLHVFVSLLPRERGDRWITDVLAIMLERTCMCMHVCACVHVCRLRKLLSVSSMNYCLVGARTDSLWDLDWLLASSPIDSHNIEASLHRRLWRNSFQISLLPAWVAWGRAGHMISKIFEEEIVTDVLGQPDHASASCPIPSPGIRKTQLDLNL